MPDFKPMLAKDGDPATLSYPVYVQPKLDGIRASVVDGKLVSRSLKPIPNKEICAFMERPEFEGLDGEIIVGSPVADDCYRRTASFVMAPNKTDEPWTFFVFDLWNTDLPFSERVVTLTDRLLDLMTTWGNARIAGVASQPIEDEAALVAYEEEALAAGHEGIIVRDPGGKYKFGRSGKKGPLLKVKRFIDFEAEIVGVYEEMHNSNEATTNELGRTARSTAKAGLVGKGTLGGFLVQAINGPAEGVEFKVGTGFDAAQRADYWAMHFRDRGLHGEIVKIKSFPIGVKEKPRHPVFLGFRDMEVDG